MAATVRSSASAANSSAASTLNVPLPTGWAANDVCYICVYLTVSSGTITTPTGWSSMFTTFAASGSPTGTKMGLYRRVLQSGDTSPVAVTTTAGRSVGVSVAVQNADTVTPEDVTPTTDDNTGVSYPNAQAPSISPTSANTLMLCFFGVQDNTVGATISITPPSGMNEEVEGGYTTSLPTSMEISSLSLSSSGATGTKIATLSFSSGTTAITAACTAAVRSLPSGIPDLVTARYGL